MRTKRASKFVVFVLCMLMTLAFMPSLAFAAEDYTLTTDKTEYSIGDPVNVSSTAPAGSGAWVGIFPEDAPITSPSYWWINAGEDKDITTGTKGSGRPDDLRLTPGKYKVVLIVGEPYEVKQSISITVKDADVVTDEGYDLTLEGGKTTFDVGEAVNFTAKGTDENTWVGLYKANVSLDDISREKAASYRWTYAGTHNILGEVDGSSIYRGSGAGDNDANWNPSVAGEYKLVLFKDFSTPYKVEKVVNFTLHKVINADDYSLEVAEKNVPACGELKVTAKAPAGSAAWVGLYKMGETYDESSNGAFSYFWY